jgi:hypothetical protein
MVLERNGIDWKSEKNVEEEVSKQGMLVPLTFSKGQEGESKVSLFS